MLTPSWRGLACCSVAVLGGLFALHSAIDAGVHRLHAGPFGAFNRIDTSQVNADIVIAGSSRAVFHYDPDLLSEATGWSAFNIGRIGAGTDIIAGILRWYLNHNRPPRLVILNADLGSLTSSDDYYNPGQYTPYLNDPGLYEALQDHHPMIWRSRLLPLYGYVVNDVEWTHYMALKGLFGIQPTENYRNGYFFKHHITWSTPLDKMRSKARRLDYRGDATGIRDFDNLLKTCQTRKIPVIVVFSPVFSEYLGLIRAHEQVIQEIGAAAHRQGAQFWDLSSLEPVAGDISYFSDPTHMNTSGAEAFSKALALRLKEMITAQEAPPHLPAGSLSRK